MGCSVVLEDSVHGNQVGVENVRQVTRSCRPTAILKRGSVFTSAAQRNSAAPHAMAGAHVSPLCPGRCSKQANVKNKPYSIQVVLDLGPAGALRQVRLRPVLAP